jgi:hypothetical protein
MIGDLPGGKRLLHTQDRRSTGNPVYNGASNAATFGTVDPTGYADRERRSGLAKSILQGGLGQSGPAAGGVDPSQLVGETASSTDPQQVIRMLAARMAAARRRGG